MKIHAIPFIILFSSVNLFAQGGPPMLTDDSGTPGDGNWENNLATVYQGSKSDYSIALPVFDLNYGVGERIQLNLEAAWTSGRGQPLAKTFDNISPGMKYRFFDEEKQGLSVSTYPHVLFSFNPSDTTKSLEYGFILPLAASKEVFSIDWNLQIGYQLLGNESEIFYGLVVGKEIFPSFLFMAELHEAFDRKISGSQENEIFLRAGSFINLGTQWAVSKTFTILAAFGKDTDPNISGPGESRFYGYFGLQVHQ